MKTRTMCLKVTSCSFFISFALVYKDLNYVLVMLANLCSVLFKKSHEGSLHLWKLHQVTEKMNNRLSVDEKWCWFNHSKWVLSSEYA